ncbi:MAG: hypothetical protein IPK13_18570 [Deltaproteobacteria bacterium]|nr:hypothetical protein [Deltaproteobacteria bacterium]
MITGLGRNDAGREAIAAGADDFLLKPFEVSDFLDAVGRTVERTQTWRGRLSSEPASDGGADVERSAGASASGATTPFSSGAIDELRQVLLDAKPKEPRPRSPSGAWSDDRFLDLAICADILTEKGGLSTRERQILEHLLLGKRNHQIAEVAQISERTVKFHVTNILKKLGAESRGDLLRMLFDRSA